MTHNFSVSEIFSSIQGEGPNIGRPSTFLRLAKCNLQCVFCDSAYTWRFTEQLPHNSDKVYNSQAEIRTFTVGEVYDQLVKLKNTHIVITGGEPLLQPSALTQLFDFMVYDNIPWTVEFETAGTITPPEDWKHSLQVSYVVSPKLENSGNSLRMRRRMDSLQELERLNSVFKFVVCNPTDFDEILEIVGALELDHDRVYIMPEGTDAETLTERSRALVNPVKLMGFRLTTRLQIYLFGNKRGT